MALYILKDVKRPPLMITKGQSPKEYRNEVTTVVLCPLKLVA